MPEPCFQPFTDRLSRDIRNDLSESFAEALRLRSLAPSTEAAETYRNRNLPACYTDYITNRLQQYGDVLQKLTASDTDPLYIGLLLWDAGLFFEVHEILEHAWMESDGEEKLFLQAMIRAAGVYIKLDAGYAAPAEKIPAKARPVLGRNKTRLSRYTDPDLLLKALKNISEPPPRLLIKK